MLGRSLIIGLACALLWPLPAFAQYWPAATTPLAGTEPIPCIQGGGYKTCTPAEIFAVGGTINHMVVINLNAVSTPPTPMTGAVLQLVQADTVIGRVEMDSFGNWGSYSDVRYDGTLASPTAVQNGEEMGGFSVAGYDGASAASSGKLRCYAQQNFTSTHHGTSCAIAVTANNSTTLSDQLGVGQNGGVYVGSPTGGAVSAGTVNVATGYYVNGVALTTGVSSVFGRTGAVTATGGDYTCSQITNCAAKNSVNTFTGIQTVNLNASGSLPSAVTGTAIRSAQADTVVGRMESDAFANFSAFTAVRFDGTGASPTAVQNNDEMGGVSVAGYDGTSTSSSGRFRCYAAENQAVGAHGTRCAIATTPIGSTVPADNLFVYQDGGVTVGSGAADEGPNTLNVLGNIYQNGSPLGSAAFVSTGTSGHKIPFLDRSNTFSAQTFISVASGGNGLSIKNSSTSGAHYFQYFPTTNGSDTDMTFWENNTTSGARIIYKANLGPMQVQTHLEYHGTAPTVGSGASDCGTSPSVVGNDNVFRVTVGSSTNGSKCTMTFNSAWTNAPVCQARDETQGSVLTTNTPTTTQVVLNGTLVAGDKLGVTCSGYS